MGFASGFGKGLLFTFLVSFLITCCTGKNEALTGGNVKCKIHGQSGKISLIYIGNNTDGNFSDTNENQLTFEVDEIAEVDAQGGKVGTSGNAKHALNSLASQQFTFTRVDNVSYYQGIQVINVNLTSYLTGPAAVMDIMIFLFLEDGNITFGNESFSVFRGSLKFNIKIEGWKFCDAQLDNCKQGQTKQTGSFIDLTLAIKSKGTPKKMTEEERETAKKKPVCHKKVEDCPETYDLGGGSEVLLNKEVLIDGNFTDMPGGYPKFETQGSKKKFIFRIPRFTDMVLIDPTANMDGVAGPSVSGGEGDAGTTKTPATKAPATKAPATKAPDTTRPPTAGASTLLLNVLDFAVFLHVVLMFTIC